MVDNSTALAQSIMDKLKFQETPLVTEAAVHQAKYVSAILRSKLGRLLLLRAKTVPIPKISKKEQRPFVRLVDAILKAKAANPAMDTTELEEKIDWLVYDLYGLTDEETAVVSDFFWGGTLSEEEEDEALVRAMEEVDIKDRVSREEVMEILLAPDEC
jgi:hypothetical protein